MRTTSSGLRTLRHLSTVGLTVPLAVVLLSGTAMAGDKGAKGNGGGNGGGNDKPAAATVVHDSSTANAAKDKGAPHGGGAKADSGSKGNGGGQGHSAPAPAAPAPAAQKDSSKGKGADKGKPASAPLTKPQPLSNADKNGKGANPGTSCTHAYCSTRDGSASQNGNGDGKATGKPCAGCVGKADNKNPKGQAPNGRDRNNGYECDGNKGIGKGNPAHTGCKPSDTAPPKGNPKDPKGPKGPQGPKDPKDCTAKGNNGNGNGGNSKGNGGNGKGNGPKCTPGGPNNPGGPGGPNNPGNPSNPTPNTPSTPVTPTDPTVVLPIVLDRPTTPVTTPASPFTGPVGFGPAPTSPDSTVEAVAVDRPSALPFTGGDAALLAQIALLALLTGSGVLYAARKRSVLEQ